MVFRAKEAFGTKSGKPSTSTSPGLDEVDTGRLAESILRHASEARNEEELKIRVETTIRPILAHWNVTWASYEHRHAISGRKDALYGSVIIEYKAPGKLDSPAEFKRAKEQVKQYIQEQTGDPSTYGRFFGIVLDGFKITFVRYRKEAWEEQSQPLQVNAHTVLRLLESIRGLRRKPLDAELLLLDFGPKSDVSRLTILALYESNGFSRMLAKIFHDRGQNLNYEIDL